MIDYKIIQSDILLFGFYADETTITDAYNNLNLYNKEVINKRPNSRVYASSLSSIIIFIIGDEYIDCGFDDDSYKNISLYLERNSAIWSVVGKKYNE